MADGSAVVAGFWQAMNGNDWAAVARGFLAPDFTCLWPQSAEVIEGRDAFAAVNAASPCQGGWRFEVITMMADAGRVVTAARITQPDLDITARAITVHLLRDGLIHEQTEFWPDAYPMHEWRAGLTVVDPERAGF